MRLVSTITDQLPAERQLRALDDVGVIGPVTVPHLSWWQSCVRVVRRRQGLDLRVWFKVPMDDCAALVFTIERRDPGAEWVAIDAGYIVSRTVRGELLKDGAVPFHGQALSGGDLMRFVPGVAFRVVVHAFTRGPWSYLAEVSV